MPPKSNPATRTAAVGEQSLLLAKEAPTASPRYVRELRKRKRKLKRDDDDDDNHAEPVEPVEPATLRFACPYYRYDPVRYRECLLRHTLRGTNHVLQHLRRSHMSPIHCPICGEKFPRQSSLDDHVSARSCEPRMFTHPGITPSQTEAIQHLGNRRKGSPEELWYGIWDILFPGVPRPPSPYVEDVTVEIIKHQLGRWLQGRDFGSTSAAAPGDVPPEIQAAIVEQILRQASQDLETQRQGPQPELTSLATGGARGFSAPIPDSQPPNTASSYNKDFGYEIVPPRANINSLHAQHDGMYGVAITGVEASLPYPDSEFEDIRLAQGGSVSGDAGPAPPDPTKVSDPIGTSSFGIYPPAGDAHANDEEHSSRNDSGYASKETEDKPARVSDDADTVYSLESVTPDLQQQYIHSFCNQFAEDMRRLPEFSVAHLDSCQPLEEWVKTFAAMLQGESLSRAEKDASVFIRKYRSKIINGMNWLLPDIEPVQDDGEEEEPSRQQFRKSLVAVGEWLEGVGETAELETCSINSEDDDEVTLPNMDVYEQFIPNSKAYSWLLSRIQCHLRQGIPEGAAPAGIGKYIRDRIREYIRDQSAAQPTLRKVSRAAPPPTVRVTFSLDWELARFFREQEYSLPPSEALDRLLCVTGTWRQAQATTLREYMSQTWPMTHEPLRCLLKKILLRPLEDRHEHETSSGTVVWDKKSAMECSISAVGPAEFVFDIGDQLGWLASTLRPSPVSAGTLACKPEVTSFIPTTVALPGTDRPEVTASCHLAFNKTVAQDISSATPGFCWTNLFRNTLLVTGYPIRRRADANTGLEISLDVMAALVHTHQLVRIGDRIILKGFSSLLVATTLLADAVVWHLFFNPSGDRISYYDARLDDVGCTMPQDLALLGLEGRRHIVGWCSNVLEVTGSNQASLAITPSYLSPPSGAIVINTAYIEGGGLGVTAGVKFDLGRRAQPVHVSKGPNFIARLDAMSEHPTILYGVHDRRAWLVESPSAVLHLVLASIEKDRGKPAYKRHWKFDHTTPLQGSTAMEILTDPENLDRELYRHYQGRDEAGLARPLAPYCVWHRVLEVLDKLELFKDHQSRAAAQDGYWIRINDPRCRKTVVGFDFWDLAEPRGDVTQKLHCLRGSGYGWVDYARSVKAMIIFGNDFWELIRADAMGSSLVCTEWDTVRTGQDLLCARVTTLKAVQRATKKQPDSGELSSEMLWSSHGELFAACPCRAGPCQGVRKVHLDPIQVLSPRIKIANLDAPRACTKITLDKLGDGGAVVFGHTKYYKTVLNTRLLPRRERGNSATPGIGTSTESSSLTAIDSDANNGASSTTQITTPQTTRAGSRDEDSADGAERDDQRGKRKWETLPHSISETARAFWRRPRSWN